MGAKEGTVTLSLKDYQEMKSEINLLKEQVKEKTIVKYYIHPIYGYVITALMFGVMFWLAN